MTESQRFASTAFSSCFIRRSVRPNVLALSRGVLDRADADGSSAVLDGAMKANNHVILYSRFKSSDTL